jgi:hypothetical protein
MAPFVLAFNLQQGYLLPLTELYFEKKSSRSLCGAKVIVSNNGQLCSATIGGLLNIDSKEGGRQILRITAGHFLDERQ